MNVISNHRIYIPALLILAGIFFSCTNDLDKVRRVTTHPDNPDETSESLHVIYTDSGQAQIEIYAMIAETYSSPIRITKFKDGLKVNFYNEEGIVGTVLTSKYGEIDEKSGNITVRDSVRLENIKDQRVMETEVLYWNKKGDSVYTDQKVTITSKDMILTGIGAWTTPEFDTAQFYRPTGKVFLNK